MATEIEFSDQFRATRRSAFLLTSAFAGVVFMQAKLKKDKDLWILQLGADIDGELLARAFCLASAVSLFMLFLRLREEGLAIKHFMHPESAKILAELHSSLVIVGTAAKTILDFESFVRGYNSRVDRIEKKLTAIEGDLGSPEKQLVVERDTQRRNRDLLVEAIAARSRTFDDLRLPAKELLGKAEHWSETLASLDALRADLLQFVTAFDRRIRNASRIVSTRLFLESWAAWVFLVFLWCGASLHWHIFGF